MKKKLHTTAHYRKAFLEYLTEQTTPKEPRNLYQPMEYILHLGGKRLRPVLTLMTAELFGSSYKKALPAALAIEVFHNFTLVHDDIMDAAPLRRGKQTVHKKWDTNTGILSGDVMLIQAYQHFEVYETSIFKQLLQIFGTTARQVCEGQQYDIDFETRSDVLVDEYLTMITYKTAVLVGAAMQIGALVADAALQDSKVIYEFGRLLGIAFQLQDDYLDAFGDPATFGKQVGGDIVENKKTFLYLQAIQNGTNSQKEALLTLYQNKTIASTEKIAAVKEIFVQTGASELTKKTIIEIHAKSFCPVRISRLIYRKVGGVKKVWR